MQCCLRCIWIHRQPWLRKFSQGQRLCSRRHVHALSSVNFPETLCLTQGFEHARNRSGGCGALRCRVLRCVALRCGAVRCGVLQCGAVRCGVSRCVVLRCVAACCGVLRCVALRCRVVRCGAVWYGTVQCGVACSHSFVYYSTKSTSACAWSELEMEAPWRRGFTLPAMKLKLLHRRCRVEV